MFCSYVLMFLILLKIDFVHEHLEQREQTLINQGFSSVQDCSSCSQRRNFILSGLSKKPFSNKY